MNHAGKFSDNGISLEGTVGALHELSMALHLSSIVEEIPLCVPTTPAAPYVGYLRLIKLQPSVDKVSVSRGDEQIIISGAPDVLGILARNIDRLADQSQPAGMTKQASHLHIEYHAGHFHLMPDSVPLVIARK